MIDIHSHILYDVDDGSKSIKQSLKYLEEAKKVGVNKVVCTPHMSRDNKDKALKIVKNFKILREEAKQFNIELYLGNEIMYTDKTLELLRDRKITTLNNSKYLLIEFRRGENRSFDSILSSLLEFVDNGYIPILAHPEFYINYRDIENYKKLKENGIMLQVDATSFLKEASSIKTRMFAKKLLKERLIDFIASDTHCTNKRNYIVLKKAYKKIRRKDKEYADIIFRENQLDILNK